ncbi:molybdopterin molybdotransferase MoeA [Arenibacter sp. GZD96]|uniref:molybdopterin molybdotransferase MoeA n=1 Tax=Aurantibrevibacter litoralis TaxID=3106030 RepID=UPI002AFF8070|nr:molybdopterin molybdotransferase MoeA [Arenibacter sp. GZD-96]MEA1785346.1 molybdopterin molybdotransferase MoeA [Arenibacter sp. GZD-96]
MITFAKAYDHVLAAQRHYGTEEVPLFRALGRVLAEPVYADRDFPPFDRATKDGIAIAFKGLQHGSQFRIVGVIAAGTAQGALNNMECCLEIMTGAVLPKNADTVVMYEDISIENDSVILHNIPEKGANVHYQGSDTKKGSVVLEANSKITAASIGVLASVGKASVLVKKVPKITLVSTGDELVEVDQIPLPHQIRKSNVHSLFALLGHEGITPNLRHMPDDKAVLRRELADALRESDLLLLSGGVSKGKFDFIPEILSELEVTKIFHGVLQKPGKPFWFGHHQASGKLIFSFPGNPVSTFVNYHVYFKDWLATSLGLAVPKGTVKLRESAKVSGSLTRFMGVKVQLEDGVLWAWPINENGSGDLTSLVWVDGFVRLSPKEETYDKGSVVPFVPVIPSFK